MTSKSDRRRLDLNPSDLPTTPFRGLFVGDDKPINPPTPAGEMDQIHEYINLFGRLVTRPAACITSKRPFWCYGKWKAAMKIPVNDGLMTPDWLRIQNSRERGRLRELAAAQPPVPQDVKRVASREWKPYYTGPVRSPFLGRSSAALGGC